VTGGAPGIRGAIVWPSEVRGLWWAWAPEVEGPAGIVGPAAPDDLDAAVQTRREGAARERSAAARRAAAEQRASGAQSSPGRRRRAGAPAPQAIPIGTRRPESCGDLLTPWSHDHPPGYRAPGGAGREPRSGRRPAPPPAA
jgi:hypothetical protein